MEKEILSHKHLLYSLTASQNVQTLYAIHSGIQSRVANIPGIQPVFATFGTNLSTLDNFFKQNQKMFETEEVLKKDEERDFTVRAIGAKVRYHYDYARTEEERDVARRLLYIVDTYKDAVQKDYESETAYLRSMVNELQQWPDLLNRFSLGDMVEQLQQENDAFEALYNTRTQSLHDKRAKGNLQKYRTNANKSFDDVCHVAIGMLLMPIGKDEQMTLETLIDIINGQLEQAVIIYHRQAGVVAS
ncbi:MAG: DUF6261 family protein [Tannerella sp.]|jgi:hypothetical protein|nr:DUF6261 family protein [Tannerella sp.]